MTTQRLFTILLLAASARAQTRFDNGMTVFAPHAAANIHTESTLSNSKLSTKGVIALADGDVMHRLVLGPGGKVLFAYDILLIHVPNDSRVVKLLVKPHDPDQFMPQYVRFEPQDVLRISADLAALNGTYTVRPDGFIALPLLGDVRAAGLSPNELTGELRKLLLVRGSAPRVQVALQAERRVYPTIAAPREFPSVRIGEAVQLDILYNASTGEKIFDVIEPIDARPDKMSVAPEDELSFKQVQISVNGTVVKEPANTWMIGTAIKMSLPRLGTVYLVAKPFAKYPFEPVGRVDGAKLTFPVVNDVVEVVSQSNIFKTRETGPVWIFRDTSVKPAQSVTLEVGPAETLLPNR
jgi:hypothetical protein